MKAVILCAGIGKRLRPFSYTIPKHILPVCNQPVLRYLLNELAEASDIREIALVVSKETIVPIREYLNEKSQELPFTFTYLFQEKPLGLAHACSMAEEFLAGEDFMMLLGDNIIPGGIKSILTSDGGILSGQDATILVRHVPDPKPYGVVEFDATGTVISMEEKPVEPKSNYVIVGIYTFRESIFSSIRQIKPSYRGELEITDAIFHLKQTGRKVMAKVFDGVFLDIGNPHSYLSANQYVMKNFAPCNSIDTTTVIKDSLINWDVSIGKEVFVEASVLSNCILLPGSRVIASNLKNSIIGNNCFVNLNNQNEEAVTLFLGDDSMISKDT